MATMVKEKRREKKKTKEKLAVRTSLPEEMSSSSVAPLLEEITDPSQVLEELAELSIINSDQADVPKRMQPQPPTITTHKSEVTKQNISTEENANSNKVDKTQHIQDISSNRQESQPICPRIDTYEHLNARLERMATPVSQEIEASRILELENEQAYLAQTQTSLEITMVKTPQTQTSPQLAMVEAIPSAPVFEENIPQAPPLEIAKYVTPREKCMSLVDAMRLYGEVEMSVIYGISERVEAEVEAGPRWNTQSPVGWPEHPMVDYLSTFRLSMMAMERERSTLDSGFAAEEKYRSTLWKIEKRSIIMKEDCKCGITVNMKATFEHASLMREKLPVAKLKLEGLLRDVHESYCHHQHAALVAHSQIDELISVIIKQCERPVICDILSVMLEALRISDGAPDALPAALRRWASVLATAAADGHDLRVLLFMTHHLFRQTRSVQWAARVLYASVSNSIDAARVLACLNILLTKLRPDNAVECLEETEEAWEEVGVRGGRGAVSSATLRERDLTALLRALPLHRLLATLVLLSADFKRVSESNWGDASGGSGVLKSCCGIRTLLAILQRAVATHPTYARLHGVLRGVACSALTALACLYQTPRAPYTKELEGKINAELEAAFAAGFTLFGMHDIHKLPTTLLTADTAKDYCISFIVDLHEKSPKRIEMLGVETPLLSCAQRINIITHAAVTRNQDHELARIVLGFLLQTGLKRISVQCKSGCEEKARQCIQLLLKAHPYLHTVALHTVADLIQVETLVASTVDVLHVDRWRPSVEEIGAVLRDWGQRCPSMLHQLLLQLDYTPLNGVTLPVQLYIGDWLVTWSSSPGNTEHAWRVLLRLNIHRVCWHMTEVPRPAAPPTDVFSTAHAVLSGEWGHSIPLICSHGVPALCTVCALYPREATHCLAPLTLLMAHSPESVSYTPKFGELFTMLLNHGPTLVQRAFGRGGVSGAELLLRLVLNQVEMKNYHVNVFPVWLHALWKVPAALGILDTAALAARDWAALDAYAASLLQEENGKEHVTNAVRSSSTAPLLCECLLRAAHAHEVNTHLFPALVTALGQQRAASKKIHVDNALQKVNANIPSEELIIYRCATAALAAPLRHPSHLTLWRLFFHMYLQRPPDHLHNSAPPGGPLIFSGLIKSRTLAQIKKRLQEIATHHNTEAKSYKSNNESSPQTNNRVVKSESITRDNTLLPALTITDLTGASESNEPDLASDSDSESEGESNSGNEVTEETVEIEKKLNFNMACYHTAAERLVREYSRWLEEGEKVQALPHHADIARFIPEQALEEAWKHCLSRLRPPPSVELDSFPRPAPPPPYCGDVQPTPLQAALAAIQRVKCRDTDTDWTPITIRSPLEDLNDRAYPSLVSNVEKRLKDICQYALEWEAEVSRISSLDSRLWELVAALRVPRPLPPVHKQCQNKCKPITFHLNTHEWCISIGAESGIKENRAAHHAGIRRLTRARPDTAKTAAALLASARRAESPEQAVKVLERVWLCAAQIANCSAAHAVLTTLFEQLAERWVTCDGKLCAELISKWCSKTSTSLQQALCGSLVAPRRVSPGDWPALYTTLLKARLPEHTVFSYLSRFELGRWIEAVDPSHRQPILAALLTASQRFTTDTDGVLLELLGVHTALLLNVQEICGHVMKCARLSVAGKLPPCYWRHVIRAAETCTRGLTFDNLGHILRDLGVVWWEERAVKCVNSARHAIYAPHIAALLGCVMRAFVAAAVALSYEPERVGWYAWSALQESWAAWILPPSILPPTADSEAYSSMLQQFMKTMHQVMLDCVGSEIQLLQQTFEWVTTTYMSVQSPHVAQEARVQMSAVLVQLAALPWTRHQWFYGSCLDKAIMACSSNDRELTTWCSDSYRATEANTLLRGVEQAQLATRLASLLYLTTSTPHTHHPQLLKQVTRLPWWHLPEAALDEALDRFFAMHHNPVVAYHDLPQFTVILHACSLLHSSDSPGASVLVRTARAHGVSHWTRAATAHALCTHRASYAQHMLATLAQLALHLEDTNEIEELLSRAIVILCMEPEKSAVLPVWLEWIRGCSGRLLVACAAATCALTALQHAAPLADAAVQTHLATTDGSWNSLRDCWLRSPWKEPHLFIARSSVHAAYACAIAHTHPREARPALTALHTAQINFIENEAIIAVWICYAARVARECTATSASSELEECRHTARSLLTTWGMQPRRSILKVVTLQADTDRSTPQHRLLIRLAECLLTPSAESRQAFESACAGLLGQNSDVIAWGSAPNPRRLVRLAVRLYPKHESYFTWEMENAPEE